MSNDSKFIAIIFGLTFLVIFGAAFLRQTTSGDNQPDPTNPVETLAVSPQPFSFGDVSYSGGIVSKTFTLKNNSDQVMKIVRIDTSCMCTKAAVKVGQSQTAFYGMEMSGIPNPKVDVNIPAGGEAEVIASFDPAAHGLAGIGSFDRTIHLILSEPSGYKDVNFSGTVINK